MAASKNLVGNVFGRLTVGGKTNQRTKSGAILWVCKCSCGNEVNVRTDSLSTGHTVSCGCFNKDAVVKAATTHGLCKVDGKVTKTFESWNAMMGRVYRDKRPVVYKYYGKLEVCERWHDYRKFLEDMGERPIGKTLDRVSGDKGYNPDNCQWADDWQQAQNRSNGAVHFSDFQKIINRRKAGATVKAIAFEFQVPYGTMQSVLYRRIPTWLTRNADVAI